MSEGRSRDELVTVVIPAYNAERFILDALRSVKEQTHRPLEVLVVNDGSTDSTPDVVGRFASDLNDSSFTVRMVGVGTNMGVANGLHMGFSQAKGDFICWLSADDAYVAKDKLSMQLSRMKDEGAMWSYYRDLLVGPSMAEAKKVSPPFPMSFPFVRSAFEKDHRKRLIMLMLRNPINGSSVMISRECVEKYGSFDPSRRNMDSDGDLWLRYSALGAKLLVLDGSPVFYRQHGGQDSKRKGEHIFDVELTQMRMLDALERSGKLPQLLNPVFKYLPLMMRPDVYRYRPMTTELLFGYVAAHPELFGGYKRWYGSRALRKLSKMDNKVPVNKELLHEAAKEYTKSAAFADFEKRFGAA